MKNLNQTTTEIDETWGIVSPYPVNISPKDLVLKINESWELWGRSKGIGVFSKTQEIEFEHASDSRGFRTGLEARESQQRTRSFLAIKCTKNEIEISSNKSQNEMDWFQPPRGHEEVRASFPNQIHTRSHKSINQIYSKREEQRERNTGAAAWEIEQFTDEIQKPHLT